jgi:hypothetical protein
MVLLWLPEGSLHGKTTRKGHANVLTVMVIIMLLIHASNFMVIPSGIPKARKLLPTHPYNNNQCHLQQD